MPITTEIAMTSQPGLLKPEIFCALDTADLDQAVLLASKIGPVTGGIKLGLEFFNANGPEGVLRVQKEAGDAQLFLDLKYHDIPNTVAGAVRAVCSKVAPAYLNVHASGGAEMMRVARAACPAGTKILAVTLLTSLDEVEVVRAGFRPGVTDRVEQLALLAQGEGMDGVVCSAHEIERLRAACGPDFILMVPGIRPEGAASGDQKRVMTPQQARAAGASHLVIGRPITGEDDPAARAKEILKSLR